MAGRARLAAHLRVVDDLAEPSRMRMTPTATRVSSSSMTMPIISTMPGLATAVRRRQAAASAHDSRLDFGVRNAM